MKRLISVLASLVCFSAFAAPIVQSPWTTTADPATARAGMGVPSYTNGFATNMTLLKPFVDGLRSTNGNSILNIGTGGLDRLTITTPGHGFRGIVLDGDNGGITFFDPLDNSALGSWVSTVFRSVGSVVGASGVTNEHNIAYNSTTWNGNTEVPTMDAVRDKIEALGTGLPPLVIAITGDSINCSNSAVAANWPEYFSTNVFNYFPSSIVRLTNYSVEGRTLSQIIGNYSTQAGAVGIKPTAGQLGILISDGGLNDIFSDLATHDQVINLQSNLCRLARADGYKFLWIQMIPNFPANALSSARSNIWWTVNQDIRSGTNWDWIVSADYLMMFPSQTGDGGTVHPNAVSARAIDTEVERQIFGSGLGDMAFSDKYTANNVQTRSIHTPQGLAVTNDAGGFIFTSGNGAATGGTNGVLMVYETQNSGRLPSLSLGQLIAGTLYGIRFWETNTSAGGETCFDLNTFNMPCDFFMDRLGTPLRVARWNSDGRVQLVATTNTSYSTAAFVTNRNNEAYNATSWNGSSEVPTKDAVRDKFESLATGGFTGSPQFSQSSDGTLTNIADGVNLTNINVWFTAGHPAILARRGIVVSNEVTATYVEITNNLIKITNGLSAGNFGHYQAGGFSITNGNGNALDYQQGDFLLRNGNVTLTNSTAANSIWSYWNQTWQRWTNPSTANLFVDIGPSGITNKGSMTTLGNQTNGADTKLSLLGNYSIIPIGGNSIVIRNSIDTQARFTFDAVAGTLYLGNTTSDAGIWRPNTGVIAIGADVAAPTAKTIIGTSGTGTDKVGGDFIFAAGTSTGTGRGGSVRLQTSPSATSTGSGINVLSDRMYIPAKAVTLTESSATTVLNFALASGKSAGLKLCATTLANDGTDFQALTEEFTVSAVNKAGTITASVSASGVPSTATSAAGTLVNTWTAVANGASVDIKCSSVSSLIQTLLNVRISATVINGDDVATITPQ